MSLLQPRRANSLTVMWFLFAAYVSSLILFVLVLTIVIEPNDASSGPPWYPYLLGAGSLAGILGVFFAKSRRLDTSSGGALVGSFRASWFLGIAFAEAPALWGFVGSFLLGQLWPYLVGMAVSLVCLALMAPTRREIDRRQQQITAQGSPLSLREALSGSDASA